jgi:hypothetical protein
MGVGGWEEREREREREETEEKTCRCEISSSHRMACGSPWIDGEAAKKATTTTTTTTTPLLDVQVQVQYTRLS